MIQELVRPIVRVGNSAGVVLPKKWINGMAKIRLIEKPLNLKREIFEILEGYLSDIKGIYLIGSYARGEETFESDIDVLVITNKINKKIKHGKYEVILISEKQVKETLNNNILPILPMLKEAKALLNERLILDYRKTLLTQKNLKWHFETTKSAMNLCKEAIKFCEEEGKNVSDNIAYSLILRLREIYLVDCLIKNKKSDTKGFLKLLKKVAGSIEVYDAYLRSKNKVRVRRIVSVKEARKIYEYILKRIKEQIK